MLGTNSNKNRCAVLLPSGTRFERLFDEVLELAVIETGLIPTRLQQNAEFPTPINVFIDEIEKAGVLLADVSENTPEIWLAVGCAIATMMATRTVHPPAGSNPVIVFLGHSAWGFLLYPVVCGALVLVFIGWLYNNAVRKTPYPQYW